MQPTDEQVAAVDAARSGGAVGVIARAGTGKTTTLRLIAEDRRNASMTYAAFNRAIVEEARRTMPLNVDSRTAHSLAFAAVGHRYRDRLNGHRVQSHRFARLAGIDAPVKVQVGGDVRVLAPGFLGSLARTAVLRFCQSAATEPGPRHVPFVRALDLPGERKNNDRLAAILADDVLDRLWADYADPAGTLPMFSHDHYFKAWALAGGRIESDVLLVDEAQDLSPVMLNIVEQSESAGAQIVLVGDPAQAIYGWRGAIDAFDRVTLDEVVPLTRSFRFGDAVANLANEVLSILGEWPHVEGNPDRASTLGSVPQPDVVLARSNAGGVASLLAFLDAGVKAHYTGGTDDVMRFAHAAVRLQSGIEVDHPDLACFPSWGAVREYVAQDPAGGELALMVHLLDEYGPQIVLDALGGMPAEDAADVVVSTAHKAKGREWSRVRLGADFRDGELPAEEWRLLYVAVTRAVDRLDPYAVPHFTPVGTDVFA